MKRIATAAMAVCLLSGTAALADSDHGNAGHSGGHSDSGHNDGGHNSGRNEGGHNEGSHNDGGQPHFTPQLRSFQSVQHNNAPQVFERRFQEGQPSMPRDNGVQTFDRRDNGPQVFEHRDHGPQVFEHRDAGPEGRGHDRGDRRDFHPEFGAPGFHPGGERPRYDADDFPRVFHPNERFEWREGHWRGPEGWFYRPWFYGEVLPWGWFAPNWWINDYWDYELPVPPYGYEWVRNGPDALLVDERTGVVVEVVPDIFY
jgi:Ni/Co efflux regulator RcnB